MAKHLDLDPLDPLPAHFLDAMQELVSGMAVNFLVRIKPGSPGVLEVPAGPDDDQVGIVINGKWRYNSAPVERANIGGAARTLDVFVTASDNVFVPGSPGEVDNTVHAFDLALVEASATPAGVDLSRKVAVAVWDGAAFSAVMPIIGGVTSDGIRFYEEKTWAIAGPLKANPVITDPEYTLGFRVPLLATKQTSRVVAAYGEILQGTSATVSLRRKPWSGSEAVPTGWAGLIVTPSESQWTPTAFALAHRDRLRLSVTGVSGSPYGISFTVVIEHTLTV